MKNYILRFLMIFSFFSAPLLMGASGVEGSGCGRNPNPTSPASQFTVTPLGENTTIDPSDAQVVEEGATSSFTVTANEGYTLSNTVEGTCPAGTWNGSLYSTGAISEDCTVIFSASQNTFTVTPSGDGNESIDPSTPQSIAEGATQVFTVTANSGYTVSTSVGGTCPAGLWVSNVYKTGPITEDCTVIFSATQNTFTVGGSLSGLADSTSIVLQNNGSDDLTLNLNGMFTFPTPVAEGSPYNIIVGTQPSGQICTVWDGSGIMGASNITNVNVLCSAVITTLSASLSELALSVTGFTEYGVNGTPSSGLPRTITITNTGSADAVNLSITYPTWPTGTTASSTCGSSLAVAASCDITVTPGANATSNCGTGIAPTPGVISVSADNVVSSTLANVVVLTYGCIYESGYVFWMDDSFPNSVSIGGKVVTQTDQMGQSPGIIWSSDGSGGSGSNVVYDAIYGISEASTSSSPDPSSGQVGGQFDCNGNINGGCDSFNIYVYYENFATGAPINHSDYAEGLCEATIDSHSDWYLPSICEMGYDGRDENDGCGTMIAPTLQNIQSNLVNRGNVGGLAPTSGDNYYWSSTEWSTTPDQYAWYQLFNVDQSSLQVHDVAKNGQLGVRCVRIFPVP